ncbi:ATP-binding cassette domain-containing protein [uncultured Maritalea sp.]|uniref:ATP-binding cassette domain-containing protein n=1 Tax=uncultured Maritalea sp. TaxID=757249 RepID=UPI00263109DB|nr:ATP-binding cassette domain-containing protein [uncultured Maritalea sp.]
MNVALELRGLSKSFYKKQSSAGFFRSELVEHRAVDNVTISVPERKIVGLVGESGSGKSTVGLMAMRLLEPTSGAILLNGTDISKLSPEELKPHRAQMQIIFQDSYSSLNPMMTLWEIVAEPFVIHKTHDANTRRNKAKELLDIVGLGAAFANRYPHELSGGQRQRVSIARALALKPKVLIADEPTSALDVSVKAQVINLLHDLQEEMGLSILFISHELSVVRSLVDEIVVMHRGRVVEQAQAEQIFQNAQHPYTKSLLDSIPVLNPHNRRRRTFVSANELTANKPRLPKSQFVLANNPNLAQVEDHHFVDASPLEGAPS